MENKQINLSGVNETMLIPMYARYLESKRKKPDFYDATAIKVVEALDYDFKKHAKNKMNMWGCAARTTILDKQVKKYITEHPTASIINIACGLDDRFTRVDNGIIKWYNIDFVDVMKIRENIIPVHDRVTNIVGSVLDFYWISQIKDKKEVLVIAEGILMYFTEEEVKSLLETIAISFDNCTLICELMSNWMVENQRLHDVTKNTSAVFKWGIKHTEDVTKLCDKFKMTGEYSMTKAMKVYSPVFISLIGPVLSSRNNRIAKFEKSNLKL